MLNRGEHGGAGAGVRRAGVAGRLAPSCGGRRAEADRSPRVGCVTVSVCLLLFVSTIFARHPLTTCWCFG